MSEDSMPSKRMVPEQRVFEVEERLVRLAASYEAEIATLTEQRDRAIKAVRDVDAIAAQMGHSDILDTTENFQCPACHWHEGHDPEEWFREEVRLRAAPSLPESPE